jgi:hypothetical protein
MEKRKIWHLVPIQECWDKTGKDPVTVKWVDTNKGKSSKLEDIIARCRLVARDFKGGDKGRDDLFAETPPLEAKRMLFSRAATRKNGEIKRKLMFIDVKKAHLNPKCDRDVYISLPGECECPEGMCGKLDFWLYGFRDAASAWENLYAQKLVEVGFTRGDGCGVVFYHEERDISLVVHGDDFTFCAEPEELKWIETKMGEWFEIKVRAILGRDWGDDKEVVILGRQVKWTKWGIEYKADPKHRKILLEYFGLDGESNVLKRNGLEDRKDGEEEGELLDPEEATTFRGLAARVNFLSQDCPDLQFPLKPCCRDMANPKGESWKKLKGVVRYLLNREEVVWYYHWQNMPKRGYLTTDSDWGGTCKDRKSTSVGAWLIG